MITKVLLLLLLFPSVSFAQAKLDLPVIGTVDIGNLLQNSGPIAAYDNHGTKWAGASLRVMWTPKDPAAALLASEVGVLWEPATGAPSGVTTSIGVRADNLAARFGTNAWINDHLGHIAVPAVELGPFVAYLTAKKEFVYGAFIAKKFGN